MIDYKNYIESIENFPKEGILFRDIQPLLENSEVFFDALYEMGQMINLEEVDYFVGIESRGFIIAAALASINLKGFKMIRKEGKLPNVDDNLRGVEYDLEYGKDSIEMKPGTGNVVIVDDVYATGGTMFASELLCKMSGYNVIDKLCLLDIGLKKGHNVKCLITYND
jgi:adenine phosphoribosyltransferase